MNAITKSRNTQLMNKNDWHPHIQAKFLGKLLYYMPKCNLKIKLLIRVGNWKMGICLVNKQGCVFGNYYGLVGFLRCLFKEENPHQSCSVQYVTLQKHFSHPSLVIYFSLHIQSLLTTGSSKNCPVHCYVFGWRICSKIVKNFLLVGRYA
jgi:hypothetical protein